MHYTNQCGPRWSVQNFREFLKSNKLDLRHPVGISTDLDDNPCLPCMAVKKIISLKNGRFPEIRRRSHYLSFTLCHPGLIRYYRVSVVTMGFVRGKSKIFRQSYFLCILPIFTSCDTDSLCLICWKDVQRGKTYRLEFYKSKRQTQLN